jgi:hypothetical protein
MKNKTWLIETKLVACLKAVTILAFALMRGHTRWMGVARK